MLFHKRLPKCILVSLFSVIIIFMLCLYNLQYKLFEDRQVRKIINTFNAKKIEELDNKRHIFIMDSTRMWIKQNRIETKEYTNYPEINCNITTVDILSIVKSSPKNKALRSAIRNTWGKYASNNGSRLIFSLGRTNDSTLQDLINDEAKTFQDILQSNFIDTYYNLTLKTVCGIHWIARYCPDVRFVLLVDDDVIVNFLKVKKFFTRMSTEEIKNLFTGYVIRNAMPYRKGSKFAVSVKEYSMSFYPSYVSGPVVLTTGKVMRMFDRAIPLVKRFVFEDVYLGMVAEKLHLKLSPKYNNMFDHDGSQLRNFACFLTSHPRDTNVTSDLYEKIYNKYKDSVCKKQKNR